MGLKRAIFLWGLLKGELRTVLALCLLLVILVGIGFAAGGTSYTFDFGTGLSSELAPGAISVKGGVSLYPQTEGEIKYGWKTNLIAEQSSGGQVDNLLETDSNQGVGNNIFQISGLTNKYYAVTVTSGNLNNSITTKVIVSGTSYLLNSDPGVWKNASFLVAPNQGNLEFNFQRSGANLWAVNALTLAPSAIGPTAPTFDLVILPTGHSIQAGGGAIYQVSVLPEGGYAQMVKLTLSGLQGGMQASFSPASSVPPFSAVLQISTPVNIPVTRYTFLINALGEDEQAYSISKQISLVIRASSVGVNIEPMTEDTAIVLPPTDLTAFRKQALLNQKFIDRYLAEERQNLPSRNEFASLQEIPWYTTFAVMAELPRPQTVLDASLRGLTSVGIIDMVVDSAPVAVSTPPPRSGFWAQFFGAMFNPAQ